MKRFLTPLFSLTVLVALILTGCANTGKIIGTGLDVEITGIERAADGSVGVSWQIKNSNIAPYMFSHVTHKIQINGTLLGVIDDREAMPLPANSNTERTSKLANVDAAANRVLTEALNSGSANYHVDTQITILVYDDSTEKSLLTNSGTVTVKSK